MRSASDRAREKLTIAVQTSAPIALASIECFAIRESSHDRHRSSPSKTSGALESDPTMHEWRSSVISRDEGGFMFSSSRASVGYDIMLSAMILQSRQNLLTIDSFHMVIVNLPQVSQNMLVLAVKIDPYGIIDSVHLQEHSFSDNIYDKSATHNASHGNLERLTR